MATACCAPPAALADLRFTIYLFTSSIYRSAHLFGHSSCCTLTRIRIKGPACSLLCKHDFHSCGKASLSNLPQWQNFNSHWVQRMGCSHLNSS